MITVYVWNYRGMTEAWGHASMSISGGGGPDLYISWWPESSGRTPKVSDKGILSNVYSVTAIKNRTFPHDVRDEGMAPDHTIALNGLDETKARKYWTDLNGGSDPQWSSLKQNCSTIVARTIMAAGGDDLASGVSGWWHSWNVVWKPDDVLAYARAIEKGLKE